MQKTNETEECNSPTIYRDGKEVLVSEIPVEAMAKIQAEVAEGAAFGSVVVGGATYSWD
jgi:hypothetical protein